MSRKEKISYLLASFIINSVVYFSIFYFFEEDNSCVFKWGTSCSNTFFKQLGIQVILMTLFFYWFTLYTIKKGKNNKK